MKKDQSFENIDDKLASANQQAIQKVVHQLSDDTLSMAWRSSLNERLIAESVAHKPRLRFSWMAMPAAGFAMAAALAFVVFFHSPSNSAPLKQDSSAVASPHGAVEMGLLDTYRQESLTHEVVGSGPDPSADASHPSIADIASDSYSSEGDQDSL